MKANRQEICYDVKLEDKPEAKKPNGRMFMEAGTEARLLQSEYEENVHKYVSLSPGYMAGKSFNDTIKLTNHLYEPYREGSLTIPTYLSFDIKKWSPGMPIENHKFLDSLFADAFGVPSLNEAHRIFTDGNMYYIKENVMQSAPKPGRDFEGFAGKKLTFFHLGVTGYAVNRLWKLGLVSKYGRFATLIDDGILRLDVPPDTYKETVEKILVVIEEVYNMLGLEISWDKTFISAEFSIFLHNIRWQNVVVSPGTRSLGKISNQSENAYCSFLDDLEHLSATVRGAFIAGAPPLYGLYIERVFDTMTKWKFPLDSFKHTAWLFTPKILGCAEVLTLTQLLGVVKGSTLTEGIGTFRSIAGRFPNQQTLCNYIYRVTPERPTGITRLKIHTYWTLGGQFSSKIV